MSASATVRVMTPEEIVSQSGAEPPFLRFPERQTFFAEREMRLRQLARGHALEGYLEFLATVVKQQQVLLRDATGMALPDGAFEKSRQEGRPFLDHTTLERPAAWRQMARDLAREVRKQAPESTHAMLERVIEARDEWLDEQAEGLLSGAFDIIDVAAAPVVGAALQVVFTHMLIAVRAAHGDDLAVFGRVNDQTSCPCCGSLPTASITRSHGASFGQRYLQCSLCGLEWNMPRAQCTHCNSTKVAYHSLALADQDEATAAKAKVLAETCEDCGHYLKIMHSDRDPFLDPVADDVASLTLDLMVSEAGRQRHGVNFLMLFGAAAEDDPPPPDPGKH
jgi:FdhE protein